jgi:predicted ATP-grasp superfamily ATP-dependent carboligase
MNASVSHTDSSIPSAPGGVVILGGAHGSLALARSLGAANVPVCYVSHDTPLPGWSRHVQHSFGWPGPDDPGAAAYLTGLAESHGLSGWLLVAGGDAEVRLVAQAREMLEKRFHLTLPPWERLQWLCEKPLLYRRAAELGLAVPHTYAFASVDEAETADIAFPVVLKPNMGGGSSHLARAKVIRTDDAASFRAAFADAAGEIGAANVVVQQLIPGGGESQFSYAALWHEGQPVAEFTARRARQYPVDFGYTSTFVEVVERPDAAEAARRLLRSVDFSGLVEIEFKYDARDRVLKLLDVNPRPWSWFALAAASGVDLGRTLWEVTNGGTASAAQADEGAAWTYLSRDIIAGAQLCWRGALTPGTFLVSLMSVRAGAAWAANDLRPGLLDLPLTAWRVLTRRVLGKGAARS